jgi:DNA-binding response OmpR family regulator
LTGADLADGVIVAENDALFSGIIRTLLENADQQVFLAVDGDEAVALARQFEARLVLLDIGMPKLNGLMACEAIRLLPGYAQVPIVMLTGYADERMRLAAMQLGANDFITKPFQPDELMARLAAYLGPPRRTPPTVPTPLDSGGVASAASAAGSGPLPAQRSVPSSGGRTPSAS